MMRKIASPLLYVGIGLLGFFVRAALMWRNDYAAFGAYDDGVHYAGAVNLIHGVLPYRDFLFLHPPGILLATTPFAWLATFIGDAHAFVAARVVFALIGGLNAALIGLLLRRYGVAAVIAGGVAYALSFPAIYDERTITLEPLGSTGLLLAMLAMRRAVRLNAGRWWVLAGVAGGLTLVFKIWYIVPLLVLFAFARGGRGRFTLGALAAPAVVLLPFFVLAPAQMFREVVLAQLGRPGSHQFAERLYAIIGIHGSEDSSIPGVPPAVLLLGLLVLGVLAAIACWVAPGGRLFVILAATTGLLLMVTPSFFQHYTILTAMPLALVVGGAVGWYAAYVKRKPLVWLALAGVLLVTLGVDLRHDLGKVGMRFPNAAFQVAATHVQGCIVADDPTAMIMMNRLTPDVAAGCRIQPDTSGYGYVLGTKAQQLHRQGNPAFQREALAYLNSGNAFILTRGSSFGLSKASQARVDASPILFKSGKWVLHGPLAAR